MKVRKVGLKWAAYGPDNKSLGIYPLRQHAVSVSSKAFQEYRQEKLEKELQLQDPDVKFIVYTLETINKCQTTKN